MADVISSIWRHPNQGEALEDHLRYLCAEGFSFGVIAERIGDVTRSACIGKAHRLGIAQTTNVRFTLDGIRKRTPARTKRERERPKRPLLTVVAKEPQPSQPQLPPELLTFAQLNNETCRYPLWRNDALKCERVYCGVEQADLAGGQPYCERHAKVCFTPFKPLKQFLPFR